MKFIIKYNFYWRVSQLVVLNLIFQSWGVAGVSDYLAREAIIKHIEGKNVSETILSEYSNFTYLVELIALGLVATALLVVTFSVFTRFKSGKKAHKKILSLRRSAEQDKKMFDETIAEIDSIGKQVEQSAQEAQQHATRVASIEKDVEDRAEYIARVELDMKQLVDGTTERMAHIQEYWEQQLKNTTKVMNQINSNLESGLEKTVGQSQQAEKILKNLNCLQGNTFGDEGMSVNAEIKQTLDLALKESSELLSQIKDYQKQAELAFGSFTNTLGGFESQAHEQFDEIFNTADMARQELNANLDESREYMKIFRRDDNIVEQVMVLEGIDKSPANKAPSNIGSADGASDGDLFSDDVPSESQAGSQTKGHTGRPILDFDKAEDLTDHSLIKSYGDQLIDPDAESHRVSLFSKLRHHGT